MNDELELTPIEPEEEQSIPSTGIDGYERPVLYTTTEDPREIIDLDAGNLRVDNNAIVKNNIIIDGEVGIGTNSPNEKLDVVGNIKSSGSITSINGFTSQSGGSPVIISVSGNILTLSVSGVGATSFVLT